MSAADSESDGPESASSGAAPLEPAPTGSWTVTVQDGKRRPTELGVTVHSVATPRARALVVHGFGEHSGRYGELVGFLAAHGVEAVTYDLRRHGHNPGPRARASMAQHTADALEVFDSVRTRRPDGLPLLVFGHSMGGQIALEVALARPDEVTGLVLSSPALVVGEHTPAVVRRVGSAVARIAPWLPVQKLDASTMSRRPEVVARYEADPLVHHRAVPAIAGATMLAGGEDALRRSGALRVPTLVVHGDADEVTSISGSRRLAADGGRDADPRPEIRLVEFPGGRHELFNDLCADETYAALGDWIDALLD